MDGLSDDALSSVSLILQPVTPGLAEWLLSSQGSLGNFRHLVVVFYHRRSIVSR